MEKLHSSAAEVLSEQKPGLASERLFHAAKNSDSDLKELNENDITAESISNKMTTDAVSTALKCENL